MNIIKDRPFSASRHWGPCLRVSPVIDRIGSGEEAGHAIVFIKCSARLRRVGLSAAFFRMP
jgi:hypothetical protein